MKSRTLPRYLLVLFLGLAVLAPQLWAQPVPSLSLKEAVDVAEKALSAEGVNVGEYYLYGVVLSNSSSGRNWYCTFRPVKVEKKGGYGAIYVRVYMDSTAEVVMPEVPVRYQ